GSKRTRAGQVQGAVEVALRSVQIAQCHPSPGAIGERFLIIRPDRQGTIEIRNRRRELPEYVPQQSGVVPRFRIVSLEHAGLAEVLQRACDVALLEPAYAPSVQGSGVVLFCVEVGVHGCFLYSSERLPKEKEVPI